MPEYHEIEVKGHLGQRWSEGFASLKLTHLDRDETLLCGPLRDQSALHGVLDRIRDLNIPLISVIWNDKVQLQ